NVMPSHGVISSARIGVAKPSRAAFRAAADHLGLAPGHLLHVGDDPTADVRGARRAGMHTLLVSPSGSITYQFRQRFPDVVRA
ncbi:MAG: HAD-IA family hydrolase, partial [Paracoccaceae bacterium]